MSIVCTSLPSPKYQVPNVLIPEVGLTKVRLCQNGEWSKVTVWLSVDTRRRKEEFHPPLLLTRIKYPKNTSYLMYVENLV